jgi:hypothetical protein
MENSLEAPLKIELPYDPATSFQRIYLKECKPGYKKGTCAKIYYSQ